MTQLISCPPDNTNRLVIKVVGASLVLAQPKGNHEGCPTQCGSVIKILL